MKPALKIAPAAERPFPVERVRPGHGVPLRLVAPAPAVPRPSSALRSIRGGGHERVLRALDRLALLGIVAAVALMPVLAAGRAGERPVAPDAAQVMAPADDPEGLGFFEALAAIGYAIWRPTPARTPTSHGNDRGHRTSPRHAPPFH